MHTVLLNTNAIYVIYLISCLARVLTPCFQHKAFTEVFLDDSHSPANCRVSVQVATPALNLSVRFPIPDLRADQERGPWFKKSLQKEILHLAFTDLEFKTEFIGGSTPEQTKLELTFRELAGKTEGACGGARPQADNCHEARVWESTRQPQTQSG